MLRFSYLCRSRETVSLITEIRGGWHAGRAFNRSVVSTEASTSAIMLSELDIGNYFEFAKELTLKAGEIFKYGFDADKIIEEKTARWDVVTEYDRKIEEHLFEGLKRKFPDHEFIGEETSAATKEKPVLTDKPTWIIDPIDGTLNYVNSNPYTCISVALAVSKELVAGIIYNPLTSEFFSAIKGKGAFLNDKPIKSSNITELKNALIEVELFTMRPTFKNRDIKLGRFEAFLQIARGIRFMGSAALSMAYIARGALDCFHMDHLQPWDVAAGVLIIREAGGTVLDTKGDEYDFMNPHTIAAANEGLASEVKQLIIDNDLKVLRKRLTRT